MGVGIFYCHEGGGSEAVFLEQYYHLPQVIMPESKGHVFMKYECQGTNNAIDPTAALVLQRLEWPSAEN